MNPLNENEYIKVDDKYYFKPQVGLDESTSFIDQLRATQAQDTQQIVQDTQNLGTNVPSNLGGLIGGESYWTSRYQTPQTNAVIANLRATAQAAALNQALQNEQAMWKKRYQDAYNAYQKRTSSRSSGGGISGSSSGNQSAWSGEPELKTTDELKETETLYDKAETGSIPPNPYSDEFNITGEEQPQRISERSGLPEWLVNILKIMSNP